MSGIGCTSCGRVYTSVGPKGDTGATGAAGADASALRETTLANAATLTLTGPDTGGLILMDRAAGSAIALPSAPADGTNFTFQTKTDPSTGNYTITTGGSDIFAGSTYSKVAGAVDTMFSATAGTETIITLNGTTSGGLIGTDIDMVYRADGAAWYVSGVNRSSGVVITPFS